MLAKLSTRRYQIGLDTMGSAVTARSRSTSKSASPRRSVAATAVDQSPCAGPAHGFGPYLVRCHVGRGARTPCPLHQPDAIADAHTPPSTAASATNVSTWAATPNGPW